MDLLERSLRVAKLSDEIAQVGRSIRERARRGEPEDAAEKELLEKLLHEMDILAEMPSQ